MLRHFAVPILIIYGEEPPVGSQSPKHIVSRHAIQESSEAATLRIVSSRLAHQGQEHFLGDILGNEFGAAYLHREPVYLVVLSAVECDEGGFVLLTVPHHDQQLSVAQCG